MSGSMTSPPSLRNNGLTLYTQAALGEADQASTWPETPDAAAGPPPPEPLPPGDGPEPAEHATSPAPTTPRKLPIPHTGANSIAPLKGMLIRPKRILPAQPDTSKVKRATQDGAPQLKSPGTESGENSQSELNTNKQHDKDKSESCPKQHRLPKLQIDVDRLKTYFLSQSNEGADAKKSTLTDTDPGIKKSATVRSPGQSGYTPHTYIGRDSTYNFSPDGLSKVREWCSQSSEMNKMAQKMASESGFLKDRNIRSPSPKSNTTWDRSSSGYSSDERADPRSPPPRETASAASKPSSNTEDDGVSVNDATRDKEDSVSSVQTLEKEESVISEVSSSNVDEGNSETVDCTDGDGEGEVIHVAENECVSNVCSCATTSDGATNNVTTTDLNQNTVPTKEDALTAGSNVSLFDTSIGCKQQSGRRPAWTLNVPPPSGRIQYRKSGSESVISLRHPSRQGINGDNSFDGLEVCGKSYPKVPSGVTVNAKPDAPLIESATTRTDGGAKSELNFTSSAFSPVEKAPSAMPEVLTDLVPRPDGSKQDSSAFKTRTMRSQFVPPRSPRDITSLSLSLAGKLSIPRDDKDFRKTIHDLNSPRRSPGGKTAPIRARHLINPTTSGSSNQPMSATDTAAGQPISQLAFTSFQRINTKKKMWRPPQGQPENAQMRPFSPFGGTLPPSKIKENEQRRHDQDDS